MLGTSPVKRALLGALALVLVARAWAGCPEVGDPQHDGKSAAEWLTSLDAQDIGQRRAAAFALWSLRRELVPYVRVVARSLGDPDAYVRSTIGKALQFCGPRAAAAIPLALQLIESGPQPVRSEIVSLVSLLLPAKVDASVGGPAERLSRSDDAQVRALAINVLGRAGSSKAAVTAAERLLADGEESVQSAAVDALARMDPVTSLSHDDSRVRLAALNALSDSGSPTESATVVLLRMLEDSDENLRAGAAVVLSTAMLGRDLAASARVQIAQASVNAISSETSAQVRGFLLLTIARGAREDPRSVQLLVEAARTGASGTQKEALLALREVSPLPPSSLADAIPLAANSADAEVQEAALYLLGCAGPAAGLGVDVALAAGLEHSESKVRRAAAGAALSTRSHSPIVARAARKVLAQSDWWIQLHILDLLAVAGTGSAEDVAAVQGLLEVAQRPEVRGRAAGLLIAWGETRPHLAKEIVDLGTSNEWSSRSSMRRALGTLAEFGHDITSHLRGVPAGPDGARGRLWRALLLCSGGRTAAVDVEEIASSLKVLTDLTSSEENEVASGLSPLLKSEDAEVRANAACAHAFLGWQAALAASDLQRLSTDDKIEAVRKSASTAVAVLRRRGLMTP